MRRLNRRQRLAAIALAIVAVCFVTLDVGGSSLRPAHSGVRGALGSLYRGTDSVLGPVRRFVEGVPHAGTNQAHIQRLQHENAVLRGQLAQQQATRKTETRLAALARTATSVHESVLPARVTALGPGEGFDWTVTLDVGKSSGVRVGQSVTDGAGLVGRVLHVDESSSVVLLAADGDSGVGVRDERSGEVGIATGRGSAGFRFVALNPDASVRVGDVLVTGPTGATSYVPGLPVGTVRAIRSDGDGTRAALVTPVAVPTQLDLVGVILTGGQREAGGAALQPGGSR
jgi:rod shape-determining protein MreC